MTIVGRMVDLGGPVYRLKLDAAVRPAYPHLQLRVKLRCL
jgi:hypothetical protein